MRHDYSYYRKIFAGEKLPFAFVDLDLFDMNVSSLLNRAGDKKIRIASKSIRCVSLIRRILESNSRFQGVMCYSLREALFLAEQGLDHFLIAYPSLQIDAIQQVCAQIRLGKHVVFMVDCLEHLDHLQKIAHAENVVLPVCIDIDLSSSYPLLHFGVRRSGISQTQHMTPLLEKLRQSSSLRLEGIMGYEAQIAGVPERLPHHYLQNKVISFLKKRSRKEVLKRRQKLVQWIRDAGFSLTLVNGGGTGSLESTREEQVITEVTAGSAFFSPTLFDYYDSFRHAPAAGFALEICRRPTLRIVTCHGGGYIASGAVGLEKLPTPYLPQGAFLLPQEGAGEVQTPVFYAGTEVLQLGDPFFFRHSKAGELCEHFQELLLVSQGKMIDRVKTYRGEGYCFL